MIDTKQEELSSFIHSLCEKEEIDVSLDYINYVLDDLMPMTRSNEEVLNSFHITKDMKEIIISNIEDIKSLSDEGLLDNFFSLDVNHFNSFNLIAKHITIIKRNWLNLKKTLIFKSQCKKSKKI